MYQFIVVENAFLRASCNFEWKCSFASFSDTPSTRASLNYKVGVCVGVCVSVCVCVCVCVFVSAGVCMCV